MDPPAPDDPLRQRLVNVLDRRQVKQVARARQALKQFDQRAWTQLARTLQKRAQLVRPDSLAAQCLALERYQELRNLHGRAVRTQQPKPWHALRVSVRRFRYTVESLLPAWAAVWDDGLRHAQDLLGAIHDLDVLMDVIASESAGINVQSIDAARRRIATRRQTCIAEYRRRTQGQASLLRAWNAGLPQGTQVERAAAARLRATACAMDPHPGRTATISQLALQVFDALVITGALRFPDEKARLILHAASQLHAVGKRDRHTSRQKAARDIVRALPPPPGWTGEDWEVLALVVRYQGAAEPKPKHRRFARLPRERQQLVRELAVVLRLAHALHESGAQGPPPRHADKAANGLRLKATGLVDTPPNAARLAAAKHLLDRHPTTAVH